MPKEILMQRAAQTSFLKSLMQPDISPAPRTVTNGDLAVPKASKLSKFLTGGAGSNMTI